LKSELNDFVLKQHRHELKQQRVRVVDPKLSDDGITIGIGKRKGGFFTRIYAFYNKGQKETGEAQEIQEPLLKNGQELIKPTLLNIELELKEKPLQVLNKKFFSNKFAEFHLIVLDHFSRGVNSLVYTDFLGHF
jgi:hypothetical protein